MSANSEKEKSAWLESLASGPHSPLITSSQSNGSPERLPGKESLSAAQKENIKPADVFMKSEHVPVKIVQVKYTCEVNLFSYRLIDEVHSVEPIS